MSKADLANIEAPAQRIDSRISSLVCRVQTPPQGEEFDSKTGRRSHVKEL